jgi:ADP-ribosylglycohydrolase
LISALGALLAAMLLLVFITAFLEGESFEDVIQTAVSLYRDCDTLICIAGAIAKAFYEVPEEMKTECRLRVPEDMIVVLNWFEERLIQRYVGRKNMNNV